jgi:phospho-N-acetylmuramoyl-pentapeptide-transferase
VGYISFRALLALILSLVISAWFGEKFIKYLKRRQITETQRDEKVVPIRREEDRRNPRWAVSSS